jgi:hypothetical protein
MANCSTCAYCGAPIGEGERWVREKIYEPAFAGRAPNYQRYHADLFDENELSCWEKHQIEIEDARIISRAA